MRTRSMRSSALNSIELDKDRVMEELNEKGEYEGNEISIRKMEAEEGDEEENDSYLVEITKNNSRFMGILNNEFKREGYGLNKLENGDTYLGYFENDERSKHGIYIWAPEKRSKNTLTECYHGFWKENKKEKNGIYIWLEEPKKNSQFDKANFDAYVGEFEDDTYKKGTYLSKVGDNYYLYYGKFDREGQKSDDNAYFYSSKNDRLLHGRISKDNFMSGYISMFDPNSGLLKDLAYCTFDKDGNNTSIILKDELQKEEKDREVKAITTFRNIILEYDYFGIIYDKYKEIKKCINKDFDSIDIFEDGKKFPKIMKLCSDYNSNNINNDIVNKIKD